MVLFLGFQVFPHKASTFEVLIGNALLTVRAFLFVNRIEVSSDGNCSKSTKGLAFQALPAGVELYNLILGHPHELLRLVKLQDSYFHRIIEPVLVTRHYCDKGFVGFDVDKDLLVEQLPAEAW